MEKHDDLSWIPGVLTDVMVHSKQRGLECTSAALKVALSVAVAETTPCKKVVTQRLDEIERAIRIVK